MFKGARKDQGSHLAFRTLIVSKDILYEYLTCQIRCPLTFLSDSWLKFSASAWFSSDFGF